MRDAPRYIYKFSDDHYDYYMAPMMNITKVPQALEGGRSDRVIDKHGIDATGESAVRDFFSTSLY